MISDCEPIGVPSDEGTPPRFDGNSIGEFGPNAIGRARLMPTLCLLEVVRC